MATTSADIIFFAAAIAIVAAQWLILRSTARGMKYSASQATDVRRRSAALEWTYAVVPAIALAILLVFSWRAMHPDTVRAQGVAPSAETDP